MSQSIPRPAGKPLLGNVLDLDSDLPTSSMCRLLKQHGEILELDLLSRKLVIVGSQRLAKELCDQRRFHKSVAGALKQVRNLAGDGLFTAFGDEENWGLAHRILVPAFGPLGIKDMFPGMKDIAGQLLQKWARFGDERIDVPADFTRLALDTIALCTFSHRFNSFYTPTDPPMVAAMGRSLKTSGEISRRLPGTSWLHSRTDRQYQEDIALQHRIADQLVSERKESGRKQGDLLDAMLEGKDPKTGKQLSSDNIRYQLVTFLIAGHETTSGMLSFLFYFLLQNPQCVAKIRAEVDEVCGEGPIEYQHLAKFEYIDASLKETLRLCPTAPAFAVQPNGDEEMLDGKYRVAKGQPIVLVLEALHKDPAVWGDDANQFRPERMLNGGFANLPPESWKPFGNGVRACIGRPFAWQEGLLAVASIFQNFEVRPDNPQYQLQTKSTLTIKPTGFYMHVKLRENRNLQTSLGGAVTHAGKAKVVAEAPVEANPDGQKVLVLYGSNAGTCKALAERMHSSAAHSGLNSKLAHLDEYASRLPKGEIVVIVTASYEGQPTDDAKFFHQALKDAPADANKGVKYAVFGCGHPDWAATFHAIPTFIDDQLANTGAQRLVERGAGNASSADLFDNFEEWKDSLLKTLGAEVKELTIDLQVKVTSHQRPAILKYGNLGRGKVVSNNVITKGGRDIKRHIVFELPPDVSYTAGDYLEILPVSPLEPCRRALARLSLLPDDMVILSSSSPSQLNLPLDTPIAIIDVLRGFVELGQVATTKTVSSLMSLTKDEAEKATLQCMVENYEEEVGKKRLSLLDILEAMPGVNMSLKDFLAALPPLRIRQYSISSSPLDDPHHATLTVAILQAAHASGSGKTFYGASTAYLAGLIPGSQVHIGVRGSSAGFHPPTDPSVPIIMACAGSGIAPFRGFLQERAIQKKSGRDVGPAFLFFGCHHPDEDALYDDEMESWRKDGIVSVRHAFSSAPERSFGAKYVQDRIYYDRDEVLAVFRNAKLYFCGSRRVADGVEDVIKRIHREHNGCPEEDTNEWYKNIKAERYSTDVFG